MLSFWRLLFIAVLLFAGAADARRVPHGSPFDVVLKPLKIGAGGAISGIDIQCDQGVGACNNSGTTTKVIRTDTYGAYIYNASVPNPGNVGGTGAWQQLVTSNSFPVTAGTPYQPANTASVYEIRIAPTNTNHLYMMINGLVYASTNKGATWTQTALAQTTTSGGDQVTEVYGPYMAVDPKNENIVVVGTATSGAFYTINGGGAWTQISGLCTPTSPPGSTTGQGGGYLVAFDPSSGGTTSTPGVYLTCFGTGIYHSTTGVTGSFSSVGGSGMPTTFIELDVDGTGNVYVINETGTGINGDIRKWNGATWATVTTGLTALTSQILVRDPNSTHMMVCDNEGNTSYFNGSSWSSQQSPTITATDIPWVSHALVNGTFAGSKLAFDPAQSNVLFYANGIGVAFGSPSSGTTMAWTSMGAGIEQLVPRSGVTPPNGNPVIAFMDRPVFTITNPNRFPTDFGLDYTYPSSRLQEGYSVDYASSSPAFIAVLAQANFDCCDTSGYSTNGGGADGAPANWTSPFAGFAGISDFGSNGGSYHGGAIAASSPTCVVITVGNGNADGLRAASGLWQWNGTTWSSPTITGIPNTATFTGTGSGTNLTASAVTGPITVGDLITGTGVPFPTTILSQTSGTAGGAGVYVTSGATTSSGAALIAGSNPGWGFAYYLVRQNLAADRVNINTVYAYNDGIGNSTPGVYRTTNCSTWTKVSNLSLTTTPPTPVGAFTNGAFNNTMRAVPGVAGNVFFTGGGDSPDVPTKVFWQSTDGGANWAPVTNVTDVASFDFGKVKPGETTAAIYLYGRVGGVLGLWRGTNTFSTWTQLDVSNGAFPGGSLDQVSVVIGDANTYGQVYVCFAGSGCKWGRFN
jgi:hypothetical protein